jgi:hypothetical protein
MQCWKHWAAQTAAEGPEGAGVVASVRNVGEAGMVAGVAGRAMLQQQVLLQAKLCLLACSNMNCSDNHSRLCCQQMLLLLLQMSQQQQQQLPLMVVHRPPRGSTQAVKARQGIWAQLSWPVMQGGYQHQQQQQQEPLLQQQLPMVLLLRACVQRQH